MIRINLLPVRQVKKQQARRRQLVIFGAVLLTQFVVMFLLYEAKSGEIEQKERSAAGIQTEIDRLKQEVGDFDKLKEQRDRLVAQRKVINSLYAGRTGPVAMLRELSDILSVGKGPTVDQTEYEELLRRDPNAGYNPRWNPRRLWIKRLDERNKRINILGMAKDHDDVAELLKRLTLSRYFKDVQLQRDDQVMDQTLGLKVIRFTLSCAVKY